MKKVKEWLLQHNLGELISRFENEKINSIRRLTVLTQDLIRELIPEVGLRADFEDCLLNLRKNAASEKIEESYTNTESLTFKDIDGTYILNIPNSEFVNEEENLFPVLQRVESCKETGQAVQKIEITSKSS
ncbi:uncharacterized protein LOC143903860 [Temnothorax americanus]|uniref:uncharacterized protein LOC143903860 n=1 Tax=Temnothorax americanus TaxID=1964332 RepID=UPI0040692069